MKILCWNVNGIRALLGKGLLNVLEQENPDILCVQETKIQLVQLTQELINPLGYYSEWVCANRPGYSGVATFSKKKSTRVQKELIDGRYSGEGRLLLTEHDVPGLKAGVTLVNVYIPNGGMGDHRIQYKLDYYDEMLDFLEKLRKQGRNLIICGDFNTAHTEIDLARPHENENITGFLPVERAWISKFIASGYVDTFRTLHPEAHDAYTWWSFRTAARKRNVGWRIDYFFVNKEFSPHVKKSQMLHEVHGSDHCPLLLEIV